MLKLDSKNTYIWGCTHHNHNNIIKYANRPFDSVEQMNGALENAILELPKNSTLIHLGDFSFGGHDKILKSWYDFFGNLVTNNIFCHFLFGNHDKEIRKYSKLPIWCRHYVEFYEILEFKLDGIPDFIVANHYPMEDWHGRAAHHTNYKTPTGGSYHIHCHTHRELESSKGIRRIHGGVDTIGFQPILVRELINRIDYNLITDIINKDKY